MSSTKALIFAALCAASIATAPTAFADDLGRSLASFSIQTRLTSTSGTADASPALNQVPSQAPQKGPASIFSDKQAKLMQDLSKAIDVIPGGVKLCLNIHY